MDNTTLLRTTSLVGLTSSLFLSGIYFCSTQLALPLLSKLPIGTSTPRFAQLYHSGAAVVGPLVALSSLSFGTAAYLDSKKRTQYAIASAVVFASLPWTRFVMWSCIQRLIAISEDVKLQEKVSATEVEGLFGQWGWMNLVRSGMAGVGGVLGLLLAQDLV